MTAGGPHRSSVSGGISRSDVVFAPHVGAYLRNGVKLRQSPVPPVLVRPEGVICRRVMPGNAIENLAWSRRRLTALLAIVVR
jgi:hypothetical protein